MLIDWFTVAAQIINFLILVALLKKFLYRPILSAMDKREANIRERLENAEERENAARDKESEYGKRIDELESKKEKLLQQAKKEVEEQKWQLTEQARKEADQKRADWFDAVEQEQADMMADVRSMVQEQVLGISRRALSDLAHAGLESQVAQVLLDRLERNEDPGHLGNVREIEKKSSGISVYSGFEISSSDRDRIREALQKRFGNDQSILFAQKEEIGFGIVLEADDQKIDWSLDYYLQGLERHLRSVVPDRSPKPRSFFSS